MARHSQLISASGARSRFNSAFTLVECLIASLVLATCVVCVAGALTSASTQNEQMDVQSRSLSIARNLMEEIAARPFDRPDDVDPSATLVCLGDYQALSRHVDVVSGAKSIADSVAYTSTVQIEFRASPSGAAVNGGDLAMITVTTRPSANGSPVILHRLASRFTQVKG